MGPVRSHRDGGDSGGPILHLPSHRPYVWPRRCQGKSGLVEFCCCKVVSSPSSNQIVLLTRLGTKIDCSDVRTKVQNSTFRGIPDANDFSKHKDFYALYLWTYCSGLVSSDGISYNIDFCANTGGKSLYNLFQYWVVWGSQIHKDGTRFYWLENGPDVLYIPYVVSVCLSALGTAVGLRTLFINRVGQMTIFVSAVSFDPGGACPEGQRKEKEKAPRDAQRPRNTEAMTLTTSLFLTAWLRGGADDSDGGPAYVRTAHPAGRRTRHAHGRA